MKESPDTARTAPILARQITTYGLDLTPETKLLQEWLWKLRAAAGISLQELAERTGRDVKGLLRAETTGRGLSLDSFVRLILVMMPGAFERLVQAFEERVMKMEELARLAGIMQQAGGLQSL